jgi:hypothetical protein
MRLFHTLAFVALSLTILIAGVHLFGSAVEAPYLSYTNLPFPAVGPARPGQAVQLEVERCNSDDVVHGYLVSHEVVNVDTGVTTLLPDVVTQVPPGCTKAISRIHVLPADLPPGRYVVNGRAFVQGRFAKHTVDWQSAPFTVVRGGKP